MQKIFISSTSVDLREHRQAVIEAVLRLGHHPVAMEFFNADPRLPVERCLEAVRGCDAYVGIIAWRYGFIPPGHNQSITELEYQEAFKHEIPTFFFLLDKDVAWPPDNIDTDRTAVNRLRDDLMQTHTDCFFEDRGGLSTLVATTLAEHIKDSASEDKPPTRKVIHLPYSSIGDLLKGRDDFLDHLYSQLQSSSDTATAITAAQTIHGLGGVGKTRLAVEYAWRHAGDYTDVLCITVDSPAAVQQNLAALCEPHILDLPEQTAAEEPVRYAAVLNHLVANPGWLLILDNADTPEAARSVQDLLPLLRGGTVLITSRRGEWEGGVRTMELDVLDESAAVSFLLDRTGDRRRTEDNDADHAVTLVRLLGRLALALEQAAAYIRRHRLSLTEYMERWRDEESQVREWFAPQVMNYPQSLAITWEASLKQLDEPAQTLLNTLAWFAPDPIPRTLVEGEEALANLSEYSLVKWDADGETFTVHRLVQEITRRRLPQDLRRASLEAALALVNSAAPEEPEDVRSWPVWNVLRPHVEAVIGHADDAEITHPTLRLMRYLAMLLSAKALHAPEEQLKRRSLQLAEETYGRNAPETTTYLSNLALLLYRTNRLEEAEPLMRRALEMYEQSCGKDDPKVAIALNNLAQLLQATNRLEEAEPLYRRAMGINEKAYPPDHPHVGVSCLCVAHWLQAANRLEEAEPLIRRALAIDEQAYGEDHPNVAIKLNNLAQLLKGTGRLGEAELLMRRALEIDEQSYGKNHPTVAIDLNNLAQLLKDTSRLDEAEPLMRRALELAYDFRKSTGHEHASEVGRRARYRSLLQTMGLSEDEIAQRLSQVSS